MANLTATQAIALLNSNPADYTTAAALRNLANEVSVYSSGKVTVLYSGNIGGLNSNSIIEGMINQGEDIRIINKTPEKRGQVFHYHIWLR